MTRHLRRLALLVWAPLLVVGTTEAAPALDPALAALPDNTWTRLTPTIYDANGLNITTSGLPWNSYSGVAYNPDIGGIIMFGGGGHGGRRANDVWIYDIARNEWRQQYFPDPQTEYPYSVDDTGMTFDQYCQSTDPLVCNPSAEWLPRGTTRTGRPWTSHSYDQMAYDAYNHKYVYIGPNFIFGYNTPYYYGVPDAFAYDVPTKQWRHMATYPNLYHQRGCAEYDPDRRLIITVGPSWTKPGYGYLASAQVWAYDAVQDRWDRRGDPPKTFNDASMVYDSVFKRMLLYGRDYPANSELWSYDPGTDAWTQLAPLPDPVYGGPPAGAPSAAFDSRNGVMLLWGEGDTGSFVPTWAYNVRTNRWERPNPIGGEPATSASVGENLSYDPTNNAFFLLRSTGFWAYRYKYAATNDSIPPAPPGGVRGR